MAAENEEYPSGRRKGPIEEDGDFHENQSGRDRDSPVLEESIMVESSSWEADPVVCVEQALRVGSENLRKIPAVKIVLSEEEWAIVPLSLNELGVLFDTTMAFKDWGYYTVPGGWEEAHVTFLKLIDYSPSFLDVFLKALREGCLPGGEPLHLGRWSTYCWGRETSLKVKVTCQDCRTQRELTARHLSVVTRDLTAFTCPLSGFCCSESASNAGKLKQSSIPPALGIYVPEVKGGIETDTVGHEVKVGKSRNFSFTPMSNEMTRAITLQALQRSQEGSRLRSEETFLSAFKESDRKNGQNDHEGYPHPREYIVGTEAKMFVNPDPSMAELKDFFTFRSSAEWRAYTKVLQRRGGEVYSFHFDGRNDVILFREWEKRMRYQFDSWVLMNSVVRAELAMTTFVRTAQDWWGAHRHRNPTLRVTFPQLCEWMKTELVPSASYSSALEAWTYLEYKGNLERYFKQLDDLRFYHHIEPWAAHAIAAKPFGPEFQARIRMMDKEAGAGGIAFPTLKELIRAHCSDRPPRSGERVPEMRKREEGHRNVHARAVEVRSKKVGHASGKAASQPTLKNGHITSPNDIPLPKRSPAFETSPFCLVCGDESHIWPRCQWKYPRGCVACGSEAHRVSYCPQRRREPISTPHRWDQSPSVGSQEEERTELAVVENGETLKARRLGILGFHVNKGMRGDTKGFSSSSSQSPVQRQEPAFECEEDRISGMQTEEVMIDDSAGEPPLRQGQKKDELLYTATLNGIRQSALWDPGAGASFVSKELAKELGLRPVKLESPVKLEVWDGPGATITAAVFVKKVQFGGKTASWIFLLDPKPPHPVVFGLDFSRAWHLTINPTNDHLIRVRPSEIRRLNCEGKAYWDDESKRQDSIEQVEPSSEYRDPRRNNGGEEDLVRVRVSACFGQLEKASVTTDEGGESSLTLCKRLHSVTAQNPEEQEQREKFIKELPVEIAAFTQEFPRLFTPPDSSPPPRFVEHNIKLKPNSLPVRRAPYVVGGDKKDAMIDQVKQLWHQGWIEPSFSPWGAPVLFVSKKERVYRMCGDFRDLNALTIDDSFPLPRVEVLLHRAGDATVFSKLDLASGFHQISLTAESRPLTAFCLPEPVEGNCLWQWTVMPFGLKNAPPTFQRAMSYALKGCENFSLVYIDDILVFSANKAQHIEHLRKVLRGLAAEAYHVRVTKCVFCKEEVEFLGHKLSKRGLRPSPEKFSALEAWHAPLTKPKQVRSFLGLVQWYKAFIPHLATIAAPLFPLTSCSRSFEWTEEATRALETLKASVMKAPCLARWEDSRKTRVGTDASKTGIAAVLEQEHPEGWRPVAFWSRRLKDAETRYHTTDREWMAVVEAVTRRWRGFLEGHAFVICSDHAALERKLTKSAHDPPVTDRQSRWIEAMMPFSFTFEYVKGRDNVVPDLLSRQSVVAHSVSVVRSTLMGFLGWLRLAAQMDPSYQEQKRLIQEGHSKGVLCQDLIQTHDGKWWIPNNDALKTALLAESHDSVVSGHFGISKTLALLSRYWYWAGMTKDVETYVQTCVRCQKTKSLTRSSEGLLYPMSAPSKGHTVSLDFVSKFTPAVRSRHDQCLVIVDKFSKLVMLKGCSSSINAATTAQMFIERVLPVFGAPRIVISDRGPQFNAFFWQTIMQLMGTRISLATSHHPQTDGQTERVIQTLLRLIRTYATEFQERWEEHLPFFEVALNAVPNASTKLSPHEIVFGEPARVPSTFLVEELRSASNDAEGDTHQVPAALEAWKTRCQQVWQLVRDRQEEANRRMKQYCDRKRKEVRFEPGELVLLSVKSHAALSGVRKHQERFVGPYVVKEMVHPNAYRLQGLPPEVPKTQNIQYLKRFKPSPQRFMERPSPGYACPVQQGDHLEWEVERILRHRQLRHRFKYYVKWKDYPRPQWLNDTAMENCVDLIQEYHREHNLPLPSTTTVH